MKNFQSQKSIGEKLVSRIMVEIGVETLARAWLVSLTEGENIKV